MGCGGSGIVRLDSVTPYICKGFLCYPPISDLHGFDNAMKQDEINAD